MFDYSFSFCKNTIETSILPVSYLPCVNQHFNQLNELKKNSYHVFFQLITKKRKCSTDTYKT